MRHYLVAGGADFIGSHILQLLAGLQKIAPPPPRIVFAPPRSEDVRHSKANIQKAKEHLGYLPDFPSQRGLKLTVEFFKGSRNRA